VIYTTSTQRPLWLDPADPQSEIQVLGYISHLRHNMGRKGGTIKQKLGAIADRHVLMQKSDPLAEMELVQRALRKMKREDGSPQLKVPAGPDLVRRAAELGEKVVRGRNRKVIRAALVGGYSFMWRSGEYLSRDSRGWDEPKCVRGIDVAFRSGTQFVPARQATQAEEVHVYQRQAKADQAGQGTSRLHTRIEGENAELCAVRALGALFEAFPERHGKEAALPLFRWTDGTGVSRLFIRDLLRRAADDVGLPALRVQVHSLRLGGATALWAATGNLALVKRVGRWQSDAVHRYLQDDALIMKGMATLMARTAPQQHPGALYQP